MESKPSYVLYAMGIVIGYLAGSAQVLLLWWMSS